MEQHFVSDTDCGLRGVVRPKPLAFVLNARAKGRSPKLKGPGESVEGDNQLGHMFAPAQAGLDAEPTDSPALWKAGLRLRGTPCCVPPSPHNAVRPCLWLGRARPISPSEQAVRKLLVVSGSLVSSRKSPATTTFSDSLATCGL